MISISGVGNSPQPTLTLSPSPYNFGNVATNTFGSQAIQVSNNTTVSATIGTPSVSGTGYSISASTCTSVVLGAAQNCTITVKFTPTSTGAVSGTLTVPFTSSQAISYTVTDTLGGTGITPITSFSFGGATGYTNLTATGATVQWTAQPLATYYIARATAGATVITSAHIAPTSLTSYNITGLTPGTTYQLQVNAYDSIDKSDGNVNTVSITTPNVTAATFNGWSDVVALGPVYTDIGAVDTAYGNAGANRWDENLGAVAGFTNTSVNTGTNQITSNTVFATGVQVTFNTDGTAPGGLTNTNNYWVIKVNSTTMQLASSAANAAAGTAIALSTTGSGNMTLMPTAVVKLGWELFTFTPSGSATSYNIYRDTSASFTTSTLVGNSTTQSFSDWTPTSQTTYYYKIKPVVTGVEVDPTVVTDSLIQVYVPPTNMSLLHRWIVNREACTTLLGFTFSTGVSRSTNYSCAYVWGGSGASAYGASSGYDQTKWDLGYSLIVDRWQNGCKMSAVAAAYGSAAPSAGSNNQVYLKTAAGTTTTGSLAGCYIKDVTSGWTVESGGITNTSRSLIRTNYPGYTSTPVMQSQAYTTCQQRSYAGVIDGNGNTKLRMLRMHETVLARAVQGVNINNRSAGTLSNIFNGASLPTYGSCNINNTLTGVSIPNPSTYSLAYSGLMNGTYLTGNCYSRYEISNLWDANIEWTSTQYFGPSASGGYFVASALDPSDNLLAGYLMNGTVGPTQVYNTFTNNTFFGTTASSAIMLPLFGIRAVSVDATLGSKTITMSNIDYGSPPPYEYTTVSQGGNTNNAVIMAGMGPSGGYNSTASRYNFSLAPTTYLGQSWNGGNSTNPNTFRCAGQVGP